MGIVKIPKGMSWAKITWQRKKKRKRKKQWNELTISKDGKKMILLLLKLKGNRIVFIGDLEHSNPLLNFFLKKMRIIKCRKVKYGAYQGGHLAFLTFLLAFM